MIMNYPTHLPKPLISSTIKYGEKIVSNDGVKIFYSERRYKKNDIISLKFRYNLEDYIEFEDFYYYDIESGVSPFFISFFDDLGDLRKLQVEIFGDVNITRNNNSTFNVEFLVVVSKKGE